MVPDDHDEDTQTETEPGEHDRAGQYSRGVDSVDNVGSVDSVDTVGRGRPPVPGDDGGDDVPPGWVQHRLAAVGGPCAHCRVVHHC